MSTHDDLAAVDDRRDDELGYPTEEALEALEDQEERLAELEREAAQLREHVLRSHADLQNFRRRAAQERDELRRRTVEEVVAPLLPVLDNFRRSVHALQDGASSQAILEGVVMIERQLRAALEGHDLRSMSSVGEAFDPARHEAVLAEPSVDHEPGTILDEIEPGYLLGDRVLRPAKVKIAQAPGE